MTGEAFLPDWHLIRLQFVIYVFRFLSGPWSKTVWETLMQSDTEKYIISINPWRTSKATFKFFQGKILVQQQVWHKIIIQHFFVVFMLFQHSDLKDYERATVNIWNINTSDRKYFCSRIDSCVKTCLNSLIWGKCVCSHQ